VLAGHKADAMEEQVFEKPKSFSRVCRAMIFVQLFFRRRGKVSR
jgi:hypothetical protein